MKHLALLLLLIAAPLAADETQPDVVPVPRAMLEKLMARYQEALSAAAEAHDEAEKAKRMAVICLSTWSGMK